MTALTDEEKNFLHGVFEIYLEYIESKFVSGEIPAERVIWEAISVSALCGKLGVKLPENTRELLETLVKKTIKHETKDEKFLKFFQPFKGLWRLSGENLDKYIEITEEIFSECNEIIRDATFDPQARMMYSKFAFDLAMKADTLTDETIKGYIERYKTYGLDENVLQKIAEVFKNAIFSVKSKYYR
ncbi:MAG: hypothetical protein ACTSXX_02075 [Candidatus Baldrarchaeia archaeon]